MPWIVPSHQAPAVALKIWKPNAFSGLGLVLGTMAPDLAAILVFNNSSVLAHTLSGQLYITLPLVLVLHCIATRLVFPWLLPRVAGAGRALFLEVALASRPARSASDWYRVGYSGLLGGFTHFWIDGFTHGDEGGWARHFLPVLSHPVKLPLGSMPLHDVLQWGLTLMLGIVALRVWRELAETTSSNPRGQRPRSRSAKAPSGLVRGLVLSAIAGAAVAVLMRPDGGPALRAELAVYGGLAGPLYAAFLAAVLHRVRETWPQPPAEEALWGRKRPWAA